MFNKKKTPSNTSKANINRYPKLEKNKPTPVPLVQVKDEGSQTFIASVYFPYIKGENCNRLLPNYSTVLGRTAKVGVFVEDLDQLQHDLEKLLSFAAVRHRLLRKQVNKSATAKNEHQDKGTKKRKLIEDHSSPISRERFSLATTIVSLFCARFSTSVQNNETIIVAKLNSSRDIHKATLKRIQLEHKRKLRLSKAGRRFIRGKHRGKGKGLSVLDGDLGNDISIRQPRIFIPRNDMSEKFWASVEPYCVDITRDDAYFLEGLIKDSSLPTSVQIPEIGTHYSVEWSDQTLSLEKSYGEMTKQRTKFLPIFTEMQKNGHRLLTRNTDATCESSLTERILSALAECSAAKTTIKSETVTSVTAMNEKNGQNVTRAGACLEHRLRRDLLSDSENQGPIQSGIQASNLSDEIILEIERCCRDVNVIKRRNTVELIKLRDKSMHDLKRQSFKTALNKVDAQVLVLYNDIIKAKQEHTGTFTRPNLQQFEQRALEIKKQQIALCKSYNSLTVKPEQSNDSDYLSDN